jgi:hypothetical protein
MLKKKEGDREFLQNQIRHKKPSKDDFPEITKYKL